MARIVAVFDDLLLGSNVVGALSASGHDVELVTDTGRLDTAGVDLLVVDLGSSAIDGVNLLRRLRGAGEEDRFKAVGVYSHVHPQVRRAAEAAGYDLVVPRSRMTREGKALVAQLMASTDE